MGRVFFPKNFCGHCCSFLAEMGRIPCYGRPESSSSIIWLDKPFWCVKLCAWSHAKCVSLLALGFTHHKGLSYQIFELEDSGLPQQGILPISAKKAITMANHRCLEKDSPHCAAVEIKKNTKRRLRLWVRNLCIIKSHSDVFQNKEGPQQQDLTSLKSSAMRIHIKPSLQYSAYSSVKVGANHI